MSKTITSAYLDSATRWSTYYKNLAERTFEQLSDDDFYYSPNEESNSIAVIIQHMSGNMLSRWTNFLTEDGEKEWRIRDDEFEAHEYTRSQLMDTWNKGWTCFFEAIQTVHESDLLKTIYIRKEPLTVIDAINRQLGHYPYHVGQIVYIGKILKAQNWKNLSIEKKRR